MRELLDAEFETVSGGFFFAEDENAGQEEIVVVGERPHRSPFNPFPIMFFYAPRESGDFGAASAGDQGFTSDPPPCPHHEPNVLDGDRSVTFTQGNGATIRNDGGSLSWRNNNPGNIRAGAFADNHDAVGEADGFAVFGSYSAGLLALEALITGPSYSLLSIYDAVARYAPPIENDTSAYRDSLANQTGLDRSRTIGSLSSSEINSVLAAIQRHEGWQEGTSTLLTPPQECP